MKYSTNFDNSTINLEYLSGPVPFRLTNDYFFRALTQTKENALKGLISATMHMPRGDIKTVTIMNPIELGSNIADKEFILDVKVCMNNNVTIDMEMQVLNYNDWPDRSIQYIGRNFDTLEHGDEYTESPEIVHIGILDFELFPNRSRLLDCYMIMHTELGYAYNDKLKIYIMTLPKRDEAGEDDIKYHTDLWASFFKAQTWEEVQMLANKDSDIKEAAETAAVMWRYDPVKERIQARADYEARQRRIEYQLKQGAEERKRRAEAEKEAAEERKLRVEAQNSAAEQKKRADEESKRADEESKRADEESKRADEEAKRAADAEAEVAELKRLLSEYRK